ncbi:putative NBD/HSP70 family sugar kinase [Sinobaca qinghaiensis]|uniref:Putative NBD/HSP70 family sugar kinase n=1 Tax=Sinobaca qinghaiensis TaxID=342944 RepID=A0A419V018_9BACL|nr:ROK family protein [Sinobaca qinghaiensis]RKD71285.1 putative NBD/HSP70 family sugar kinase [Sinobaca qinghaiensis]
MPDILVFDIGGTYVKHGIVNEKAEMKKSDKYRTPETLEELINSIRRIWDKSGAVQGAAVSAPGAVGEDGIIYGTSALPYFHGPNIKAAVQTSLQCPVYLENDANCAAYAEVWNGAGADRKNIIVMTIGTGIGGAVIKNRELHKGAHLHGGEFGYMLTNWSSPNPKTWSETASMGALVDKVNQKKSPGGDTLTGQDVYRLAEEGDVVCKEAIANFYRDLAAGIYNIQYVYDPEVILIGGGISERESAVEEIQRAVDKLVHSIPDATITPKVLPCSYRQHANIIGAAYGFFNHL